MSRISDSDADFLEKLWVVAGVVFWCFVVGFAWHLFGDEVKSFLNIS